MKKILVAEDNDSNYVLMTYLLKKDFEFDRAKNGKIAVDMVEAGNYDLRSGVDGHQDAYYGRTRGNQAD